MGIPRVIPSPEQLQYLFGIHPDQQKAEQAQAPPQVSEPGQQPQPISQERNASGPNEQETQQLQEPQQQEQKPAISAPPAGGPRGISVPPAEPTPNPNLPGVKAEIPQVIAPNQPRPISSDQAYMQGLRGQEDTDRAEVNRLNTTGSGVDQFMHRHHILGPIVKGLSIAGSAFAPGVAAMVPGTDLHHQMLVNQAGGRVATDIGQEQAHESMMDKEAIDRARQETADARRDTEHVKAIGLNEKFIAGSEQEDASSPTGYTAQTFGGERRPYTPPQTYKPTKNTKAQDFDEIQQEREHEATRLGLKGDDRKFYLANGKLKEPGQQTHIHVPSAEAETLHDWKTAFESEHGRAPNADEILAYKHGNRGAASNQHTFKDTQAIDKYSQAWYDNQRKEVLAEKAKVKSLNPDAAGDDKTLQQEYQRIEGEYAQRAQQFEHQKQKWYGSVQGGRPVTVDEHGEEQHVERPSTQQSTGEIAPATHSFSISAWSKAHPGQDVSAAKAEAQRLKYKVIP